MLARTKASRLSSRSCNPSLYIRYLPRSVFAFFDTGATITPLMHPSRIHACTVGIDTPNISATSRVVYASFFSSKPFKYRCSINCYSPLVMLCLSLDRCPPLSSQVQCLGPFALQVLGFCLFLVYGTDTRPGCTR